MYTLGNFNLTLIVIFSYELELNELKNLVNLSSHCCVMFFFSTRKNTYYQSTVMGNYENKYV